MLGKEMLQQQLLAELEAARFPHTSLSSSLGKSLVKTEMLKGEGRNLLVESFKITDKAIKLLCPSSPN